MRQRSLIALAATAVAALTLSACATGGGGATEEVATAPISVGSDGTSVAQPAEKVNLRFQSLAYQEGTVAAVKKIVDDWNAANPNIQVELVQGSWDSVHDQLVTQFQGETAPDIIHDESSDIAGFAQQGYLADLSPYLSAEVKASVPEGVWEAGTVDGKIVGAPTLLQSYVAFANTKMFEDAGVALPTGDSMTWDDFQALAKSLTANGKYGLGWGLKSPTATIMNMSLGFDGGYFTTDAGKTTIDVSDAELEVPRRIHEMAYTDNSIDPTSLTQSGSDVLPGFYAGNYAMVVGGNFIASSIKLQADPSFTWQVLPPLAGSAGPIQAANPQTLSVAAQSAHPAEAAAFVNFFMGADNLAAVATGDWLIPSSTEARAAVLESTGGVDGWDQVLASGEELQKAPFLSAVNYPQWKDQIATPNFQQFLANQIDLPTLQKNLADGWGQVGG